MFVCVVDCGGIVGGSVGCGCVGVVCFVGLC